MDIETLELIRRSQAGDDEAFAVIFHKHKNLVYKTAYLMLGGASEAEEMLQEVFLDVYRSLKSYLPAKAAFTTWLYRITVNDCLNNKRSRRWRWSFLSWDEVLEDKVAALTGSCVDISSLWDLDEMNDTGDEVWLAIDHLSPKLRAVVVLRYYWDMSYAEITQVLNVPLGTVKSRLNQALQIVKRELEQKQHEVPRGAPIAGRVYPR